MKKNMIDPAYMTNRELFTEYERSDNKAEKYSIIVEMTRRLHYSMVIDEKRTVSEFKHWKLNGAGDLRI